MEEKTNAEQRYQKIRMYGEVIRELGVRAELSDYKRGKMDACIEMMEFLFKPEGKTE